jgi:hypothetical protein
MTLSPLGSRAMLSRLIILIFCFGSSNAAFSQTVGFVAPSGNLPPGVIATTGFVTINAISSDQVEKNLAAADGHNFLVNIDFSLIITSIAKPKSLRSVYIDATGTVRQKIFEPTAFNKIRRFLDDDQVEKVLTPYLEVLARHKAHVGVLYLCDEPYIAGITKLQMENEARFVRRLLKARDLSDINFGITFASAMFDRQFAELIDLQSSRYVSNIDDYAAERMNSIIFRGADASDFTRWVSTIRKSRLATYDLAGNMYTGGGIPAGFGVVGFDFYLSTILLDATHENTLSWFAANSFDPSCLPFAEKSMSDIRQSLSFFGGLKSKPKSEYSDMDRKKLDSLYSCRMESTLDLLKRNLGEHHPQLILISESSINGVLNFDDKGNIQREQSMKQAEARALDEVRRAETFYLLHINEFGAGLIFFPFEDTRDVSISLNIGGASSMPKVMRSILEFSRSIRSPRKRQGRLRNKL